MRDAPLAAHLLVLSVAFATGAFAAPTPFETVRFWDFSGGLQGWEPNFDVVNLSVSGDGIEFDSIGVDPWLTGPPVDYPPGKSVRVSIRMRSAVSGMGQLFWGRPFSETASVRFGLAPLDTWWEYVVDLPPLGSGVRFRLDPATGPGRIAVAWIRAEAFEPTAPPPSGATLSGMAAGRPISISIRSRTATAIHSVVWNGVQFIDDYDHGRQLQSASNHGVQGHAFCPEGHNPTEGGSRIDGAGRSSTSRVLSAEVTGNQLITSARLAYWQIMGQTNPVGCRAYAESGPLSNHTLEKTVTLGVRTPNAGFVDNLIRFDTTFVVDPDVQYFYHQFEALTGYMPSRFSVFKTWNPASQRFAPLSRGPGEQTLPVVIHTPDEQFAMGVFSFELPQRTFPAAGYGRFAFPTAAASSGRGVNKWNAVYRIGRPGGGPTLTRRSYSFTQYVAIGTLEDVGDALSALVAEPGHQLPGDCNEDGILDISDGICLLVHLFLGDSQRLSCGDNTLADPANTRLLNSDGLGGVDLTDAVYLFSFLFLHGPPPVLGTECVPSSECPDVCRP